MSAQVGPGLGDSFRKNLIEPLFFRSWIVLPWQVHPLELGVPNHPKNGWSVHHFFRFYVPQKKTSTTKKPMVYHGLSSLFFKKICHLLMQKPPKIVRQRNFRPPSEELPYLLTSLCHATSSELMCKFSTWGPVKPGISCGFIGKHWGCSLFLTEFNHWKLKISGFNMIYIMGYEWDMNGIHIEYIILPTWH